MYLIRTGIPALDQNIDAVRMKFAEIDLIKVLRGRLITGIVLPNGTDLDIEHRLDRQESGWFVVDLFGAVSTGRIERMAGTHDRKKILRLRATGWGGAITVSLWVF